LLVKRPANESYIEVSYLLPVSTSTATIRLVDQYNNAGNQVFTTDIVGEQTNYNINVSKWLLFFDFRTKRSSKNDRNVTNSKVISYISYKYMLYICSFNYKFMKNFALIFFVLINVLLNAQSVVFNNMYNYIGDTSVLNSGPFIGDVSYNRDSYYRIAEFNDSTYLLSGQSYSDDYDTSKPRHLFQFNSIIDADGIKTNEFNFDVEYSGQEYTGFTFVKDSVFYIGGGVNDSVGGELDFLLSKFSLANGLEWTIRLNYGNYEFSTSMIEVEKNLYITHTYQSSIIKSLILKIDKFGNILDTLNYNNSKNIEFSKIIHYNENSFLILSKIEDQFDNYKSKVHLINMDTLGNVLWEYTFQVGTNDYNNPLQFIFRKDNLGIYICGWGQSFIGGNQKPFIIKTDYTGNLIWQKEYDQVSGSMTEFFKSIQESQDGNLIVGGSRTVNETSIPSYGPVRARLLKIDTAGEIIWDRLIHRDTFTYENNNQWDGMYSMHVTTDNSILISDGLFTFKDKNIYDIAISIGIDADLHNLENISKKLFENDNVLSALEYLIFQNNLLDNNEVKVSGVEEDDEW